MLRGKNQEVAVSRQFEQANVRFIRAAYQAALNREPDQTGMQFYLAKLESGVPRVQVFSQIRRSREAKALGVARVDATADFQKIKQLDVGFIRTAYQAILNREPDPEGLEFYLAKLEDGASRAEVFSQLCRSREAKAQGASASGISWFRRRTKSRGEGNASSPSYNNGIGLAPANQPPIAEFTDGPQMSAQLMQLADQLKLARDISEGLANAVQGLQKTAGRHEQMITDLNSKAGEKDLLGNEVVNGLGLAIRSFESVLKRHEKAFVLLRSEMNDRLDSELNRIEQKSVSEDDHRVAQAQVQTDLHSLEERLVTEIDRLEKVVAGVDARMVAQSENVVAPNTAIAAFEREQERIGEIVRSCDSTNRTIGLKMDALDQKAHWLSVDNDNIRKRIEFIRKEIMFEIQRIASQSALGAAATGSKAMEIRLSPEIKNRSRFEFAAGTPKRANLGCGHLAMKGFANVDARDLPGVDIVADLRQLPFDPSSMDELRATHVIEHFTEHSLLTEVLPHWASLLRPGGTLTITAPDSKAIIAGVAAGEIEWETAKNVLMGGQEYEGDFHFALLDPKTVCSMLEGAGFAASHVVAQSRKNGDCLEFEIIATR